MKQVAVFLLVNDEGRVLVEKRTKDELEVLSGQFLFPGGGIEDGEDLESGLLRELSEELGIKLFTYQRLAINEKIIGINNDVTLIPFFISLWEGEIPKKILDEDDLLSWVEVDFMLGSPIEPTKKIAEHLRKHLLSIENSNKPKG